MAALVDLAEVERAFTRCISILEMLVDRCDRVEHYRDKGVEFEDAEPPFRHSVHAIWPPREIKKARDYCRLLDADLYASLLLKLLNSLPIAVDRAQAALGALSEDICTTLSKVGPDPWRPTVRRSTLDKLIFWPIDPHRRVRLPDCWKEWEALTRQSDPRPAWCLLREQLESFRSDAISIRGEVSIISLDPQDAITSGICTAKVNDPPAASKRRAGRPKGTRKTTDERMRALVDGKPEAIGWSAEKFATSLGCAKSTVAKCKTWKQLQNVREMQKQGLMGS